MFNFLKKLLPFLNKPVPSVPDVSFVKDLVQAQLDKVSKNKKVVELEIDLQNKVSKSVAEIVLKHLADEYTEKLGKSVSLIPKNCF